MSSILKSQQLQQKEQVSHVGLWQNGSLAPKKKKTAIVISGPSGSGKSTLIKALLKSYPTIRLCVSCTTRQKRQGEVEGEDYYFVTEQQFSDYIIEGKFLEYVICYGNRYGTLKTEILSSFEKCDLCLFDLDFKGAHKLLSETSSEFNIVGILILPPSLSAVESRLENRCSETKESLEKRLKDAFDVDAVGQYDHIIINKYYSQAFQDIEKIIQDLYFC